MKHIYHDYIGEISNLLENVYKGKIFINKYINKLI